MLSKHFDTRAGCFWVIWYILEGFRDDKKVNSKSVASQVIINYWFVCVWTVLVEDVGCCRILMPRVARTTRAPHVPHSASVASNVN